MPTPHPVFEIVTTSAGAISIRNKVVNEIMHNPVGPWVEANALYIDQSELRKRLQEDIEKELVIFDIGLGAAANALATLACIREVGDNARPARLISFERDLELLQFALENSAEFAHFKGYELILEQVLKTGIWSDGKMTWELRHGDFLELIDHEPHHAHLIFFDPYSPQMNKEMWSKRSFTKLRAKCRDADNGGATLFTYSQSTRIRTSLILAGFYVGYGKSTGLKEETTQASTDYARLPAPLAKPWFERWGRSDARHSFDCEPGHEMHEVQLIAEYAARVAIL